MFNVSSFAITIRHFGSMCVIVLDYFTHFSLEFSKVQPYHPDKCVHSIFDQISYYALFIIVLLMLIGIV